VVLLSLLSESQHHFSWNTRRKSGTTFKPHFLQSLPLEINQRDYRGASHPKLETISMRDVNKTTCPFCKSSDYDVISSNDHAMAVYDDFPVTPGHSLIIPKRHIASFFEATKEEQAAMFELLSEIHILVLAERSPDGFNIGINDGTAAGQTVMHLHIHLIPRYAGDTSDPRGGVRWIMPEKAPYWKKQKVNL
jgi:diadenosine tetraphosphate (Ap4A) HIT family hydrolase